MTHNLPPTLRFEAGGSYPDLPTAELILPQESHVNLHRTSIVAVAELPEPARWVRPERFYLVVFERRPGGYERSLCWSVRNWPGTLETLRTRIHPGMTIPQASAALAHA